jgi:hypothetical protein
VGKVAAMVPVARLMIETVEVGLLTAMSKDSGAGASHRAARRRVGVISPSTAFEGGSSLVVFCKILRHNRFHGVILFAHKVVVDNYRYNDYYPFQMIHPPDPR